MALYLINLIIAEIAASSAVIFIKLSTSHPLILASYRLLFAAVLLTPAYLVEYKKHFIHYSIKNIKYSIVPAVFLSLHFITWITGAKLTLASNATIIVNMVPVVMPFVSLLILKEKLYTMELIGTSISMMGIVYLSIFDFQLSSSSFKGDVICFISMILFAFYLGFGRKNRNIPSVWLYVVPLYYFAGVFTIIISMIFINPFIFPDTRNLIYILGLAIIPTIIGHSLMNYAVRYFKSQTVSIINQIQLLFASIMAFIFLKEIPSVHLYIASFPIIGGSIIVVTSNNRKKYKREM